MILGNTPVNTDYILEPFASFVNCSGSIPAEFFIDAYNLLTLMFSSSMTAEFFIDKAVAYPTIYGQGIAIIFSSNIEDTDYGLITFPEVSN